jgi:hypothetical protein
MKKKITKKSRKADAASTQGVHKQPPDRFAKTPKHQEEGGKEGGGEEEHRTST